MAKQDRPVESHDIPEYQEFGNGTRVSEPFPSGTPRHLPELEGIVSDWMLDDMGFERELVHGDGVARFKQIVPADAYVPGMEGYFAMLKLPNELMVADATPMSDEKCRLAEGYAAALGCDARVCVTQTVATRSGQFEICRILLPVEPQLKFGTIKTHVL